MSQVNYTLQYRPVSELISEVELYLQKYNSTPVIQPSDIIDTAWKCTYDLGLRIFKVYEDILEIYHYNAKLPDAFYSLNYAMLCGSEEIVKSLPSISGQTFEVIPYEENVNMPCDIDPCNDTECNPPRRVYSVCDGNKYEVIQHVNNCVYRYRSFIPVRLKHYTGISKTCDGCPNIDSNSHMKSILETTLYILMSQKESCISTIWDILWMRTEIC